MLGKKLMALIMALAMVMSTAVFIYAEDETAGTDPSVTAQQTVKDDQVIKVNPEKTIVKGRAGKIKAALTKGNGVLTFASSDKKVVTVDKNGKIKAKGYGEAVITITAAETDTYNAAVAEVRVEVVPKAITLTSLVCNKHGKFTVKWKKLSGIDGFEIQYSKDKHFKKGVRVKPVKNGKAKSAVVKKQKAKTRIYVKIRVYKTVDGVKYYSAWSKAKSVRIK